jgi:hypothetical protein
LRALWNCIGHFDIFGNDRAGVTDDNLKLRRLANLDLWRRDFLDGDTGRLCAFEFLIAGLAEAFDAFAWRSAA